MELNNFVFICKRKQEKLWCTVHYNF